MSRILLPMTNMSQREEVGMVKSVNLALVEEI